MKIRILLSLLFPTVFSWNAKAQTERTAPSAAAQLSVSHKNLKYCISLDSITFYPFRERASAYENFYLLPVTRSYISTDENEPGLLAKWYFSPDGKTFTATVAQSAQWQDGTPLSARDAALGIARGFLFRIIGGKVKVQGAEALKVDNWFDVEIPGIKIKSNDTFELQFESEIKNLSGVVREALSTNSRPNRVWPARTETLRKTKPEAYFDVISKFPIQKVGSTYILSAHGQKIELATQANCKGSDFFVYQDHIDSPIQDFTFNASNAPQSLVASTNYSRPGLGTPEVRNQLVNWLRSAYLATEPSDAVSASVRHFEVNEAGYLSGLLVPKLPQKFPANLSKAITILSGNPLLPNHPLRKLIEQQGKAEGVQVNWKNFRLDPIEDSKVDVFIQGARHENGRQLWMQDVLEFKPILPYLTQSERTVAAFKNVAKFSSSTVPVDNVTLQKLEEVTAAESMVVPLARYSIVIYSKKSLPIELVHTSKDEFTFIRRKP